MRLYEGLSASSHEQCDGQTDADPDDTEYLCVVAQVYPNKKSDQNAERREEKRESDFFFGAELVMHKSGGVDADKRDKCAEVE